MTTPVDTTVTILVPVYDERHLLGASFAMISSSAILSHDGSWEILQQIAASDTRLRLFRNETNMDKGAAIRAALAHATCDITVVHDADLEYNPFDTPTPKCASFLEVAHLPQSRRTSRIQRAVDRQ
jgi:glycosyltransferase involved in cell wall biosynthesis